MEGVGKEVNCVCVGGSHNVYDNYVTSWRYLLTRETVLYLSPTLAENVQSMEAGRATVNLEGNIKWWNRGCASVWQG